MKKLNKFFFPIFLFFFIFISINSFASFSIAGTIENPVVDVDLLSVSLGSFQDSTTGDGSGKLKSASGGYDLISFINYGVYSFDSATNQILYRARAKFGFEVNVWTACIYQNIFPNININKETSVPFFSIQYWKHIGLCGLPIGAYQTSKNSWFSKYREISYGSTYYQHNYDGNLPITVVIDNGLKFSGEITLQGQAFTVPQLTSDIINVRIDSTRGGECGSYEDFYTNSGYSEGSASLTVLDPSISITTQKVVNWLNDHDLGWQESGAVSNDAGATIQQGIRDTGCIGTVFSDPSAYNSMLFNLPVHLQPKVTRYRQYIDFTKGSLHYYKCCGDINNAFVDSFRMERDVSVHVTNQFVHYDFEMEVDLFMTVQCEGSISQSFLSDPDLQISDMLWDDSILGSYKVDVGLTREESLWNLLIWIIIISGVIIVLYVGYRYYKKSNNRIQIINRK